LRVFLAPLARRQLAALPAAGAERVVKALRLLQAAPFRRPAYPDDSPFRGDRYKTVVVRARRWTYRITYTLRRDKLWVRYIYPSWYPLTHPGLSEPADD
jgi:mRNA-degrading endonuclease RelE of RelBE toxin-antitoxin system